MQKHVETLLGNKVAKAVKNLALEDRLSLHLAKVFPRAFTRRASDWSLKLCMDGFDISTALRMEQHIKQMKSRTYLQNLVRYPELRASLLARFGYGACEK